MTSKDDMVIRPSLKAPTKGGVRGAVTPQERHNQALARKHGILGKLARARAARRLAKARAARGMKRIAKSKSKAEWLIKKAIGLGKVAITAAAVVATRLGLDVPFAHMGVKANEFFFKRLDVLARAHADVMDEFLSDPHKKLLAERGTADRQLMTLFRAKVATRFRDLEGDRILNLELSKEVDSMTDVFILRLKEVLDQAMTSKGKISNRDRMGAKAKATQSVFSRAR